MAARMSFSKAIGLAIFGRHGRRFYSQERKLIRAATFDKRLYNVRYEVDGKQHIPKVEEQDDDDDKKTPAMLDKMTLQMSVEAILTFTRKVDFSWRGFKNYFRRFDREFEQHTQRYIEDRHRILGPDLATAHFVLYRGGGVRFVGQTLFHRRNEDNDEYVMPNKFVPNIFVEAIDLQGVRILYEGMVNLENLAHLRWLSLRGCSEVDDWFCSRLAHYRNTLEYLDISDCTQVTDRGVACLHRLRFLKTLKMRNLPRFKNRKLVHLLLEDVLPNCVIEVDADADDETNPLLASC